MLLAKIGKQGGRVQEYAMAPGSTVKQLVEQAGIEMVDQLHMTLNGKMIANILGAFITNKDVVMIDVAPACSVRIARLGESLISVAAYPRQSIAAVLSIHNKYPNLDEEVWVHYEGIDKGEIIGMQERIRNGMILVVEKKKVITKKDKIEKALRNYRAYQPNLVNELMSII